MKAFQRGHANLEPVMHLFYLIAALGMVGLALTGWALYRCRRGLAALAVRIVAIAALLLWPLLYPITLLAAGLPHQSIWQDFLSGAAFLVKRIKQGGL